MSREIKFRAWDEQTKRVVYPDQKFHTEMYNSGKLLQRYSELMQFTGLRDKNGKEIYEGDIVQAFDDAFRLGEVKCYPDVATVYYLRGKDFGLYLNNWEPKFLEVIGNIYENPELLNSEQKDERGVTTKSNG